MSTQITAIPQPSHAASTYINIAPCTSGTIAAQLVVTLAGADITVYLTPESTRALIAALHQCIHP